MKWIESATRRGIVTFAVAICSVLVVLVLSAAVSSGQESEIGKEDLVNKAADYAMALDVSLQEASSRVNLIERARPILVAIRQEAVDTLSGIYFEHTAGTREG